MSPAKIFPMDARRRTLALAVCAALTLGMSACSSDDGGGAEGSASSPAVAEPSTPETEAAARYFLEEVYEYSTSTRDHEPWDDMSYGELCDFCNHINSSFSDAAISNFMARG